MKANWPRPSRGVLTPEQSEEVLWSVIDQIAAAGSEAMAGAQGTVGIEGDCAKPARGAKGKCGICGLAADGGERGRRYTGSGGKGKVGEERGQAQKVKMKRQKQE